MFTRCPGAAAINPRHGLPHQMEAGPRGDPAPVLCKGVGPHGPLGQQGFQPLPRVPGANARFDGVAKARKGPDEARPLEHPDLETAGSPGDVRVAHGNKGPCDDEGFPGRWSWKITPTWTKREPKNGFRFLETQRSRRMTTLGMKERWFATSANKRFASDGLYTRFSGKGSLSSPMISRRSASLSSAFTTIRS